MSILIGHASIDENGRAGGGQAGDQTGKEVYIGNWYAGSWNIVLRPKSSTVAEKMAAACEALCRGNLVGYDQGQRNTLWDELEKVGWDATKLTAKCETDCSAFVSACTRAAGIDIPRVAMGGGQYNAPVTYTMRSAFSSTGAFDVLVDQKYLTSDKYLKRGDVLVRESGHTAMVLGNGALADTPTQAASTPAVTVPTTASAGDTKEVKATGIAFLRDTALTGKYKCTASTYLSARDDSGEKHKELTRIKPGEVVDCWGYFNFVDRNGRVSLVDGVKWLYVQFEQDGVRYTAFACGTWLKKI